MAVSVHGFETNIIEIYRALGERAGVTLRLSPCLAHIMSDGGILATPLFVGVDESLGGRQLQTGIISRSGFRTMPFSRQSHVRRHGVEVKMVRVMYRVLLCFESFDMSTAIGNEAYALEKVGEGRDICKRNMRPLRDSTKIIYIDLLIIQRPVLIRGPRNQV